MRCQGFQSLPFTVLHKKDITVAWVVLHASLTTSKLSDYCKTARSRRIAGNGILKLRYQNLAVHVPSMQHPLSLIINPLAIADPSQWTRCFTNRIAIVIACSYHWRMDIEPLIDDLTISVSDNNQVENNKPLLWRCGSSFLSDLDYDCAICSNFTFRWHYGLPVV